MGWATTKDGNIKWFTKRFKLGVEECSINVTKMNKEDMILYLKLTPSTRVF